ncbi:hypothetical protein Leryth_006134 [Lithospermum erythrorhizon]|nr:hypothetical protein Leryth_006134 [Lithospermum erythrorhizon]
MGLWAFSSLPRPMEFLRLVGYTDISGGNNIGHYNNSTEKLTDITPIGTKVLDEGPSKLNLTIAGGPPPTKQNYRAIISLPLVGRNLRARFSSDPNFSDQFHVTNSLKVCKDQNIVVVSENESRGETSESRDHNDILQNQSTSSNAVVQDPPNTSGFGENRNVNAIASGDQGQCSSQEPSDFYSTIGGIASCVDGNNSKNGTHASAVNSTQCDSTENRQVGPEVLPVDNHVPSALEKGLPLVPPNKKMDFDPIRQHRHFCPWITSTNNSKPGWQQTLAALQRHNEFSSPSAESASSSLIEVDDPIESIRKLFTPPSSKRTKLAHRSKAGEVSAVRLQDDFHAL